MLISSLLVTALLSASPPASPAPSDAARPQASLTTGSAAPHHYELDARSIPLTGLLPSRWGGARFVHPSSGDVRSVPEQLRALGHTDLANDYLERLTARWIFLVGSGALALVGAASIGVLAAGVTFGAPAQLGLTQGGLVAIATAGALTSLSTAVVFGVIGVILKPLPVSAEKLAALAAEAPSGTAAAE